MAEREKKDSNAMVDRVFAGVQGWSEKSKSIARNPEVRKADLELALTILLVDLAGSDQNFDQMEYQTIVEGLKSLFGTSALQVKSLVNQASLILKDLRGTSHYGSLLKDNLSDDQRNAILEIVDSLVAADGKVEGFEQYVRYKISASLGLNLLPTTS